VGFSSGCLYEFGSAKNGFSGTKREKYILNPVGVQAAIALAERAAWCQEYARSNAQALRKIAKKHDKVSPGPSSGTSKTASGPAKNHGKRQQNLPNALLRLLSPHHPTPPPLYTCD